ncbi:MAG: glycerol-3-phosphate dehydrogenase/oxidase [Nitriliruptorales bacterium]|nr:glycerol-3-phosphate dehydrogenase/oxidase [Nitriliruptorales bacterium]
MQSPDPRVHGRERALQEATGSELDVLVVGGGITGVGVALDAAARGYRTALVERDDLASGTSSRSSKLVHGGIRYLAQGDLAMVAESVRERDRLRRLAPHLVRPLPFALPTPTASRRWELKAGMLIYDALAFGRNVRRHQRLDLTALLHDAPGLARWTEGGGYRYFDCQTDDARLNLTVALAARRHGALVANHVEVRELLASRGRVVGALVEDRLSGQELTLRARWVVSATGIWADHIRQLAPAAPAPQLAPSRGAHLTFPRHLLPVNGAVSFPSTFGDGRLNFAVPWGQQVYVGTTDRPHTDGLTHPGVHTSDAEYLVQSASAAFGVDISVAEAVGGWAGLRPLMTGAGGLHPKDLSRRHALVHDPGGLLTITGGKLTTYRQMAEDVVDVIAAEDGNRSRCLTSRLALGVVGDPQQGLERTRELTRSWNYPDSVARSLFQRHGDAAPTVLELCRRHGEDDILVPGLPYLTGEVRWAVRHELARTLSDVLERRLRVAIRHAAAGGPAIAAAARIMADELGWDDRRLSREIDEYLGGVAEERGVVALDTSWREDREAPMVPPLTDAAN